MLSSDETVLHLQTFMSVTERLTEEAKKTVGTSLRNSTTSINSKSWLEMENLAIEKLQLERSAAKERELAAQRQVQDDVNRQIR